jgi:ring-1,2-phenylacetyl-CoA epoxidase subunit PaaE
MSVFYKLPIREVRRETSEAVSIAFEVPEHLKSEFSFEPGQYVTMQKDIDGSVLRRAYSICSSPASGELRVSVKEVPKGRFSQFANRKLKSGDEIEVTAPEGRFTLEASEPGRDYIAFVAGSGITPVISMIQAVLEEAPDSRFVLVYGNKSKEKTIFREKLDQLMLQHPDRLKIHYVYSQIISDKAFFGRIDRELVKKMLREYGNRSFDTHFLCGPEEMIETVRGELIKEGVDEDRIKVELFTSTSHKKEVKKDLSGNTHITVILDDEKTEFEMRKDEFILDAALVKGLDAPYSCQGGICSSCLARVTEGKATMEKNSILDEDEVEEGFILTCQAHPVTDTITIDYDDV